MEVAKHRLPILAAILMQSKRPIRNDDKLILPIPYPSVWPETVEYVHTLNRDYLSEAVKGNIANLGGTF